MSFRERLREEISFSGLSNKEVASKAGITVRSLVSYVSAQECMPSAEVAVRLAKALGTTVEYLMTGEPPLEPGTKSDDSTKKLFSVYRSLPPVQRKLLLSVAEDIAQCLKI